MIANSAVPAPGPTGTCGIDGVSESASKTTPRAVIAIQAGEPRYIRIAKIS